MPSIVDIRGLRHPIMVMRVQKWRYSYWWWNRFSLWAMGPDAPIILNESMITPWNRD